MSTSTGEPLEACGLEGYGEAKMYGRGFVDGEALPCADVATNFEIMGIENGVVVGKPCDPNPNAGCTGCTDIFKVEIETPEPEEDLEIGACAYIVMQDPEPAEGDDLCRFGRAALWIGLPVPVEEPPLIILGHNTLGVADAVPVIEGEDLVVSTIEKEPCGCLDGDDCCEENALYHDLKFMAGLELILANGAQGPFKFASGNYTAYNGGAYESGACEQDSRFDWWLIREP